MASSRISVTLRVRDLERTRLFMWELMLLRDEMRVMASPHAERLDRLIERYAEGGDDDRPDDLTPSS